MRNLAMLLERSDEEDSRKRMQFLRSLVPNALVLRQPDGFVCGVCGQQHAELSEASSCLRRCLRAREREGVITCAPLGEVFTCPHCGKRYARREDAVDCHGRERRLSKIYFAAVPKRGVLSWDDSSFMGLKESDVPGVGRLFGHRLRLEAAIVMNQTHDFSGARPPPQRTAVVNAVQESRPVEPPMEPPAPRVEPEAVVPLEHEGERPHPAPKAVNREPPPRPEQQMAPPPAEEDTSLVDDEPYSGEGPFREPNMKPFKRHDARYVCSACGKNYFTKSEVEECYFSHPERLV